MFSRDHWPTEAIWQLEEPVDEAKPFKIPKREVWEAYKRVKANQGAAGVDGQSIAEFEADLKNNLYKLWNRLYDPGPDTRCDCHNVCCIRQDHPSRISLPRCAGKGAG